MSAPTNSADALARFAAELRFEDLPDAVVAHMKRCLLDTMGCALFGSTLPWSTILRSVLVDADGAGGSALVWGTATELTPLHAALANGTAAHAFELDDLHPRSIVHPGSVAVSAALAAAPRDGRELLTALVAGYEVTARVGMSVGSAHLIAGWHPTGTHGTLAAAAAAGSVLGLSPAEMSDALGIAGSQSSGLMASQYGSMVKRFHAGRAAQSGLYAALLARRGFTGIANIFEEEYGGYGHTFSPRFDPEPLTAGLGTTWETLNVGFKIYSTNGSCHPTIDALREMRADAGLEADDVDFVDVYVSSATYHHVGWPYVPNSVTTAQMNLSYIVAAVLTDGEAFVEQFTDERVRDPKLVALADRVRVHADPEIDAAGDTARHRTRLVVTRFDGSTLSATRDAARGSARDPIDAAEVDEKYMRLAGYAIDEHAVAALRSAIDQLDSLENLSSFIAPLRAPSV
jgi:aconitate decarboxylase